MKDGQSLLRPSGGAQGQAAGVDTGRAAFKDFLRTYRLQVFLVLLCAFAVRAGFVMAYPPPAPDTRYHPTAINLLEGRGFSVDAHAPYSPSEAATPLYPLFVAAVYALFGRDASAVAWSQAFLDLFTCLLVAFVSFSLAPAPYKERASLSSLVIYGVFSWPTMVWIVHFLAEMLTFLLMMAAVALGAVALRKGARYWFGAGLACGLAILARPDSVLLLAAFALFLLIRWARQRSRVGALNALAFCLAVGLSLAPWVARNYVAFGKFQPLASEYGCPRDCYFPTGHLWWVRTWLKDETYFDFAFNPSWFPGMYVDPGQIPPDSYDSEEERRRVADLIARYNQAGVITPEIDEEFRRLGDERVRRAPLRFFVLLPLYRTVSMWLTGFSTSRKTPYVLVLRVLSVLPIHIGGALGLALWCRHHPLAALLVLIVLVRTAFMAYHYAPETRYVAEIYPPMIAACGVTAAAVWSYVGRVGLRLIPARRRKPARGEQT